MALLAILGTSVAVTLAGRAKVNRAAGYTREATRLAERAALDLGCGATPVDPRVTVEPIDAPAPDGFAWVRVKARVFEQSAALVALRSTSAAGGGQ